MTVELTKDDIYFQAMRQAILELFPEYETRIGTKRECARLYLHLTETQRLTKNDHIMKIVAARFNAISPELQLTNMSAAQYFCKKFKLHAKEPEEPSLFEDKNIQHLINFLYSSIE